MSVRQRERANPEALLLEPAVARKAHAVAWRGDGAQQQQRGQREQQRKAQRGRAPASRRRVEDRLCAQQEERGERVERGDVVVQPDKGEQQRDQRRAPAPSRPSARRSSASSSAKPESACVNV